MTGEGYRTLHAGVEATGEFEDRRSRFIAQLRRVGSEAEAEAFVAEVRARHHDARHNVPAWILADGRERCSDDGEPSRTSGMPTLEVLRGAGLQGPFFLRLYRLAHKIPFPFRPLQAGKIHRYRRFLHLQRESLPLKVEQSLPLRAAGIQAKAQLIPEQE